MRDFTGALLTRSGLYVLAAFALAIHAALAVSGFGQDGSGRTAGDWIYCVLVLGGALACATRAVHVATDRYAWTALAVGLGAWGLAAGYEAQIGASTSFPSSGDVLALAFYPAAWIAIYLFARPRIRRLEPNLLLDGAIGALAAAAYGAALNFNPLDASAVESTSAIVTRLAFSGADLLTVCAVVAVFALTGWRPGLTFLLAGIGLAGAGLADLTHVHQAGAGLDPEGTALSTLWPAAAVVIAYAALEPERREDPSTPAYWRMLVVPVAFAMLATSLLVYNEIDSLGAVSFALAVIALMAATVRPALGFRENLRALSRSRHEALTDALTGLHNRRKLMQDLREQIGTSTQNAPSILVLFDLDGFKQYNDTYGHPAGDALLARLGGNLVRAVSPYGGVYRMGGDEFCVLLKVGASSARTLTSIAAASLSERGEGFSIRSSYGTVMLPQEAREPALALKIADQRMYAQKESRRPSTGRQTRDILLQVLRERDPELGDHMSAVGELSRRVGQKLKLMPEELDETVRAAELHDIGKMAIPDAILHKPGPLDENEWEFVRKHTIIGERILSAAPALVPVAKVVRSSHERWDGGGYPDKLAGEAIPIGARVVTACDALHAMTSSRPYGTTLTVEEGLAEVRKGAGSEFDPRVVEALCDVIAESHAASWSLGVPAMVRQQPSSS